TARRVIELPIAARAVIVRVPVELLCRGVATFVQRAVQLLHSALRPICRRAVQLRLLSAIAELLLHAPVVPVLLRPWRLSAVLLLAGQYVLLDAVTSPARRAGADCLAGAS